MELAINPQKHALGCWFCQRYFKCDSEYSYCRMSKLFILPAALKTAKPRSLLVAYFPWRPLDRTEKDCDLRWGGAAAWCKCSKPWLSPEQRLAFQLFQSHVLCILVWRIHLLSRLQVSCRQHGSTDHDWRSSILLLKSQDQGPIICRSAVLHSMMHNPQFLEPRTWCYFNRFFNLSFFCSSKNCFIERSGSETDQHIIRSFSKDGAQQGGDCWGQELEN